MFYSNFIKNMSTSNERYLEQTKGETSDQRYERETKGSDVPKELVIGRRYHCRWAKSSGMSWVLLEVMGDKCRLETPHTGNH